MMNRSLRGLPPLLDSRLTGFGSRETEQLYSPIPTSSTLNLLHPASSGLAKPVFSAAC
jgi:hypothetical protein